MRNKKIVSLILVNTILFASFGFTFIEHHCNMANSTDVSVLQFNLLENNYSMPASCCRNEQEAKNDFLKTDLKNNCCELNQNKFELSPTFIFNTIQEAVIHSDFYQKSIDDVKNSEAIKQLENYYDTAQDIIVKPTINILKFISKISSLKDNSKEDSQK
ncbi:MAG TPA: hypothetical protein P5216_02010 [Bacteroidota bacterium]|nr:hypothetical protein [Bacteroidota bacterium]